jgi:hypothetical protein
MSTKQGLPFNSAIEIDDIGTDSKVGSPDTPNVSRDEGRGFVSLRGHWVSEHIPDSRWVYETKILRNKKWPRYAILIRGESPRFELIEPREKYGKREIKLFRTLSANPWIRTCMGDRIRPLSDGFMCLLIDMHLVRRSYPAIFDSILCKLYYGDIPSPKTGPVALLREIGLEYATHYCSQTILSELSQVSDEDSLHTWNWSLLRDAVTEYYRNWYDKHKSNVIRDFFSPVPRVGDFFRALEETVLASAAYTKDIWNITFANILQGSEWKDTRKAIKAWSNDGAIP